MRRDFDFAKQQQVAMKLHRMGVPEAESCLWWAVTSLVLQARAASAGEHPSMFPPGMRGVPGRCWLPGAVEQALAAAAWGGTSCCSWPVAWRQSRWPRRPMHAARRSCSSICTFCGCVPRASE